MLDKSQNEFRFKKSSTSARRKCNAVVQQMLPTHQHMDILVIPVYKSESLTRTDATYVHLLITLWKQDFACDLAIFIELNWVDLNILSTTVLIISHVNSDSELFKR